MLFKFISVLFSILILFGCNNGNSSKTFEISNITENIVLEPNQSVPISYTVVSGELAALSITVVSQPQHGSINIDDNNTITYIASNIIGNGQFTIELTIGNNSSQHTISYQIMGSFNVEVSEATVLSQFNSTTTIEFNIEKNDDFTINVEQLSTSNLASFTVDIDTGLIHLTANDSLGEGSATFRFSTPSSTDVFDKSIYFKVVDLKPTLAFSDLISGPSTGLGDGLGSGVIVTVWGYKLDPNIGNPSLLICQNQTECAEPAYTYYWKDADGTTPSGPANLFKSHQMQEIAFSIPELPNGAAEIVFSNQFGVSVLPFTIRDGDIYHIKQSGDDASGIGSFDNPWQTVSKADSESTNLSPGSTLYIHNVLTGDEDTQRAIYNNNANSMSSLDAQFSYVAYPGFQPEVIGGLGFSVYAGGEDKTEGFVVSKLSFFTAEADEDENGQPTNHRPFGSSWGIHGTKDGRAIGNFITDTHQDDETGACPDGEHGAITGGAQNSDGISNFKVFGNHIDDYGCKGTSRFHHTTYFTIRSASDNRQLVAPEIAWNYLTNNTASAGLHFYDENHAGFGQDCGQFTTTFKVHNNVIINQSGVALSLGAACPMTTKFEYENNLVVDSGQLADFDDSIVNVNVNAAVSISIHEPGVSSDISFTNNMFWGWNAEAESPNAMACLNLLAKYDNVNVNWNSNICYSEIETDLVYIPDFDNDITAKLTGENNLWYVPSQIDENGVITELADLVPTTFANSILQAPEYTIENDQLAIGQFSPLIGVIQESSGVDIYGNNRGSATTTIGPVEYRTQE